MDEFLRVVANALATLGCIGLTLVGFYLHRNVRSGYEHLSNTEFLGCGLIVFFGTLSMVLIISGGLRNISILAGLAFCLFILFCMIRGMWGWWSDRRLVAGRRNGAESRKK